VSEQDDRGAGSFDAEGNYILEDTGESLADFDEGADTQAPPSDGNTGDEVARLAEENARLRDQYVRKLADFDNFRKRNDREKADFFKYALADFMRDLLPVLDSFDRAVAVSGEAPEEYRRGLELLQKQLVETTGRYGLTSVESSNVPFDPEMHEGIMREEDASVPSHTVTEVLQKGYFLHDRLLRPAMVKVAVGGPDIAPKSDGTEEP
jgi:molecular chaperone GrpE